MTLMAVMVFLTIFAFVLLAAAPSFQIDTQRERELESIRRGEEISNAIHQYILFNYGRTAKVTLPTSLDDLREGIPYGTKKRQIVRESALTDPLSPDGKWRLVPATPEVIAKFAKRVQAYNGGVLPASPQPSQLYDQFAVQIVNQANTEVDSDMEDATAPDPDMPGAFGDGPFIGVASQSTKRSVVTYYGLENHSKWLFTPMFRGTGAISIGRGGMPPRRRGGMNP